MLAVAVALGSGSAAQEPVPPERDPPTGVDDPLFAEPTDPDLDSGSGNEPEADPLAGPIEPESGEAPEAVEPLHRAWVVQFRVHASATYDDNIFIQAHNKESDLVIHVAPGITYVVGDTKLEGSYLSLRYDADASFFLDHSALNSVDHDVLLRGQWQSGRLTLGGFFQFQDLTGGNNDAGGRVNRKLFSGGTSARLQWSEKTALELEVEERKSDNQTEIDTQESIVRTWAEYEYSSLTAVSVGVTAGTVEVTGGGRQNYVQLLGRLKYEVAAKVKLQMHGGFEVRDYAHGSSTVTPVFDLSGVYTPYELLNLSLDAYRNVQPSITVAGVDTIVTGVKAGVNYRLLGRLSSSLTGGYERSEYARENGGLGDARNDSYFFVRGGLQYPLTENWRIGAFHDFRRNDSSQDDRSFQNKQTGLEMALAF